MSDLAKEAQALAIEMTNATLQQRQMIAHKFLRTVRLDEITRVHNGANNAAWERTPGSGSRELNYFDFAFYLFNRKRELNGQQKLTPQQWLEHER